ncbi:carboxylic ester hydrolase [Favolaschia claudopus]|uniref:Carboxylic ester hydrolase n=1 Tax=Favolaschia claudopus TaxID=2862362 RepID=A0AAW0CZ93_9AGAR
MVALSAFHAALLLFSSVNAASVPVVDLGYAKYQGVVDSKLKITAFRGIRYAAPPTGSLRFRAPAAPSSTPGVQQAFNDPPQCYQGNSGPLTPVANNQTEDCLFLNVYTPSLNPASRLPTIVWIYGGGYTIGFAGEYNGAELVQDSNNQAVSVVINYRLGLFGFLGGQQVKEGGSLNAGLLDQEFALKWVRANIHKFGGDPNKVTIWGESAGAGSVVQQVIANGGKTNPPLFRAAISSSFYNPPQYQYNHSIPETWFNEAVTQAGCTGTAALDCLRAVDGATLAKVNRNITNPNFETFLPVVDGSFIRQVPSAALAQGRVNVHTLLAVTNADEGGLFIDPTQEYDVAASARNLFPLLGVKESNAAAALYASEGSSAAQAAALRGDAVFKCPTHTLLGAFSGHSYKANYAIPPAYHAQDLINYFPSFTDFGVTLIFNNTAFVNAFAQSFTSFAVNLDPNVKLSPTITPVWKKWSRSFETEMVFNKTENDKPAIASANLSSTFLERCEFWYGVRHLTVQ